MESTRVELIGRYREPKDSWLPFMEEARTNYLLQRAISSTEQAFLVRVMAPYTKRHLMLVADSQLGLPVRSIMDLTDQGLTGFLQLDATVARTYFRDPQVSQVDFGMNFTTEDSAIRRKLASISEHLHSHIVGYTQQDLSRVVSEAKLRSHKEWRAGMYDPLLATSLEVFGHEVVATIPGFEKIFAKTGEAGLTFKFIPGWDGFSDPNLAVVLKLIHQEGQKVYDEVGGCFCATDSKGKNFRPSAGGRYLILPKEERVEKVQKFIESREWLSSASKRFLRMFATNLKNESQVLEEARKKAEKQSGRVLTEAEMDRLIKETADKNWPIKGFAYTLVWSSGNGQDLYFGFDPKIFSASGMPPSSRVGIPKVFWRSDEIFSDEERGEAEQFEANLVNQLQ